MEVSALTVSQLSNYIKQIFEAEEMLYNVRVLGEISGLSKVRGVAYFTLKDDNAMLSCVCFDAINFNYNNGDSVIVTGNLRYYVKGGKLNFNVSKIEKYGVGELYQKFLELKQKLEQKGYFSPAIKKEIPKTIKRVGVVSSKEGAVIQDIINVGHRRNPYVDIVLYPVKVQGVNAEYEIAKAINYLDNYNVDVIIVARGGGAFEDLQPFNTEQVADAVFNCSKFVVSAVGHETDFTICDFCSDLRAPTPSAAAELIFDNHKDLVIKFKELLLRLSQCVKNIYLDKHENFIDTYKIFYKEYKNFNNKKLEIFKNLIQKFITSCKVYMDKKLHNFELLASKLNKLNPNEILRLGYATVNKNGNHILSVKNVEVNDNLQITLVDGLLNVIVKDKIGEWNGIWRND